MTVSERSGLSNGWPSGGREQGKSGRPSCAAALQSAGAVSAVEESTAASMSDEEDSGNQLETWMLMVSSRARCQVIISSSHCWLQLGSQCNSTMSDGIPIAVEVA